MAKFAYIVRFNDETEKRLEARPRHREYLAGLLEQGKLVASGPFTDESGALIIYEADDEAEARKLIADDPYAAAGVVMSGELKEWTRVYSAS